MYGSGPRIRFVPAAMASPDMPERRAWTAWCTATREEEHAVSIVMLAPRQSKKYEIRFDTTERAVPVGKYCDCVRPLSSKH